MTEIARLRIEIDDVTPPVIRRVEVPVTIRLDDLHFVLQIAIGWQNCHPFEFRVGETAWGLLDRDDPESSPRAAETATLADVLALTKTFRYDYVYGEDWGHTVELEAMSRRPTSIIRASSALKAAVRRRISADQWAMRPFCRRSRIPAIFTTRA